ncbi:unnamed protein product [Phyllotreta striolata]|uniref:Uncharacterized protein n=1 Tax=Phyllotreta striolata TaxID=444603 RepID=A0A9N9U1W9_PHYSR|nr:unnamed protein product [Phyllotreta striolata]
MWQKVKKYFFDYCEHSSIIGFNYVAERRSKGERLLWLLLVALALALSIYFILQMWYKYDENPFIVSLATRVKPIFTIPFPAVTICPASKSHRSIFNYTNAVHRIWNKSDISDYEQETVRIVSMVCKDSDVNLLLPQCEGFSETFYRRLHEIDATRGYFHEATLCEFMGRSKNCSELFVPIILDQGICYTFNILDREEIYKPNVYQFEHYHQHPYRNLWNQDSGYPRNSRKDAYPRRALQAGADNSLTLLIPQLVEDADYLCQMQTGYTVTIHVPNTIPLTLKDYKIMPSDESTTIIIEPDLLTTSATVKSYKLIDRQCYFSDEKDLAYFRMYTQENCLLECLTNFTLKTCGCVDFFMPHENTTEICGNSKMACLQEAQDELKMLELDVELDEDPENPYQSCECLPVCTQLSYKTDSFSYKWRWKEYFMANNKLNITEKLTQSLHFSMLQVYFKSDRFLPSEKNELYGPFDFLSNFGGLLGLFTGFSLLSAVELVYFVSVRLWCNRRLYNDLSGPPQRTT